MNSIQIQSKMDTILMISKNGATSDPHRRTLNLSDKIKLKMSEKYVSLSNLRKIHRKI